MIPLISRKYERDVDLMLAEEFSVAPDFASLFLQNSSRHKDRDATVIKVHVSRSDATGESDLVVIYERKIDGGRFAFHIEDKIDAPLMVDQEDRYRKRALNHIAQGEYSTYETFLCAPLFYFENEPRASGFDNTISYEAIAEFFATDLGNQRRSYRAEFIRTAATKSLNKWSRIVDEATNRFWKRAHEIAKREFAALEMKLPQFTAGANWIELRPRLLRQFPIRTYFSLKGPHGIVDLTFNQTNVEHFINHIGSRLSDDMTLVQTGRSAAIRIETTPFEIGPDEDQQLSSFKNSLSSCAKLASFVKAEKQLIVRAIEDSMREMN